MVAIDTDEDLSYRRLVGSIISAFCQMDGANLVVACSNVWFMAL